MPTFKHIFIILLISIAVICCKNSKNKKTVFSENIIAIEVPELESDNDPVKISEVFDLVECIRLESDTGLFISGEFIPKIREYKNQIYLLDENLKLGLNVGTGNIYKFDKNGTFQSKIGRQGKGPGEYLNANDFDIWENELFISDFSTNKIIFHSLSGAFIKEIKPDFRFNVFNKLDANSYFFWLNNYNKHVTIEDNEVIMCDSTLQKITGLVNEDQKANLISINSFSVFNSLLSFKRYCNEKIYCFDKHGNISEFCNLKFNVKNSIPEELLMEDAFTIEGQIREHNYARVFQYFILKDYLYFEIKSREKQLLLYSKKTGKIKLIYAKNIINDVDETGSNINISGTVYESNTLIGYVCAHDIVDNTKNPGTKITSLSEKISEEDNPVIVYYKIIDF